MAAVNDADIVLGEWKVMAKVQGVGPDVDETCGCVCGGRRNAMRKGSKEEREQTNEGMSRDWFKWQGRKTPKLYFKLAHETDTKTRAIWCPSFFQSSLFSAIATKNSAISRRTV